MKFTIKFILSIIMLFTTHFALAQKSRSNSKEEKPKPRKIIGIPEAFPTQAKIQRKWYVRWTIRGKLPSTMLSTFVSVLEDEKDQLESLIDQEKERSKPRRSLVKYYQNYIKWDDDQIEILRALAKIKSETYLYTKDHPAHIKKREELEDQIKEKVKEFRKIINKKPSKPE